MDKVPAQGSAWGAPILLLAGNKNLLGGLIFISAWEDLSKHIPKFHSSLWKCFFFFLFIFHFLLSKADGCWQYPGDSKVSHLCVTSGHLPESLMRVLEEGGQAAAGLSCSHSTGVTTFLPQICPDGRNSSARCRLSC